MSDGTWLDVAVQARQAELESRWDEAERLITSVKAQRWRLVRNRRLLAQAKALLAENARLINRPFLPPSDVKDGTP